MTTSTAVADLTEDAQKMLVFAVDEEHYAADILRVAEIRRWEDPTPIPNARLGVCGVINVRGQVVPIYDPRVLLGMPPIEPNEKTVTILLSIGDEGTKTVGLVVERVLDVRTIRDDELRPPPEPGSDTHVRGFWESGDELLIVLDLDRLIDP